MKRIILLSFVATLLLAGCAGTSGNVMPQNLVMLTPIYPTMRCRCTGVAVDSRHIMTANHCIDTTRRAVLQNGREVLVQAWMSWPHYDIALLETNTDMQLAAEHEFQIGVPTLGIPAHVYGNCPFYFAHVPRVASYVGYVPVEIATEKGQELLFLDQWVTLPIHGDNYSQDTLCGGDSGGIVVQNDHVVGIVSAVASNSPFWYEGSTFFAVPPYVLSTVAKNVPTEIVDNSKLGAVVYAPACDHDPC